MKPPVAAKVDLRGFAYMPLDLAELFNSDTWLLACRNPFAAAACINLWGRAWHQVPAGSLPDDEALLAGYAGVPDWAAVRDIALRGFVKAEDGRLYHTVLCRKVKIAWAEKQGFADFCKSQKKKGAKGNAKRWKEKKKLDPPRGDPRGDPPAIPEASPDDPLKGKGKGKEKEEAPSLESPPTILDADLDAGEPDDHDTPSRDDGTRISPDWRPDPQGRAFAAGLGYADAAIDFLAATFRDYWIGRPGEAGLKADWNATWRNWCRNERKHPGPGGAGGLETLRGGPPGGGVVAALGEVRASRERPGVVGKPRLRF